MANILEVWAFVGFLGFTLAVPLGPVNAEVIKQALDKAISEKLAWGSAMFVGIGAMTGDFIIATSALTIGGEVLADIFSNPVIKFPLFLVNILILGFLGVSALSSKPIPMEDPQDEQNNEPSRSSYFQLSRQYVTGFSLVVTSP